MDEDITTPSPRLVPAERPEDRSSRWGDTREAPTRRVASAITRTFAGVLSAAVLAGVAVGWSAANGFDGGFLRSSAIGADAPHSLDGDMNILLIGLDTRKDQDGKDLPAEILDQLHAGDGDEGGYNANTLILVHIPADMSKITAVSIPRDDLVSVSGLPGYSRVKIKETYGLKKAAVQDQMQARGVTDPVTLEHAGREAGRASVIQAVRALTGVPIDRFAEVTLAGFYDLAKALDGVEVCLNQPVLDAEFSGADFPAGRQRLDPSQALAFVRQRHGLTNGDLDRTHRQQAFLTAVALELRESGTFTDVGKLSALMDVAHRNVVLSDDWNITDFLRTVGSADNPTVEFRTLPVLRYDVVNGQDVNIIDPAAIRREVRAAFGESESSTTVDSYQQSSVVVDIVDAGMSGSATALSSALTARGFPVGAVRQSAADGDAGAVYYGPGGSVDAGRLAQALGGLPVVASSQVTTGRIKVVLGADFVPPSGLVPATTGATPMTPQAGAIPPTRARAGSTTSLPPTPDAGHPFDAAIAGDSVPCVN